MDPIVRKSCTVHPVTGQIVCNDPIFCEPPAIYTCSPSAPTLCQCFVPPPVEGCVLTITYAKEHPALPTLTSQNPSCDAAGMELALAVVLARLLGAP